MKHKSPCLTIVWIAWMVLLGTINGRANNPFILSSETTDGPQLRWTDPLKTYWTEDGQLVVSFMVEVSGSLGNNTELHLQPMYVTDVDTLYYPELLCFTPNGRRYARRRRAVEGDSFEGKQTVVKHRETVTVGYNHALRPFTHPSARVVLSYWVETCCDKVPLGEERVDLPVSKCVEYQPEDTARVVVSPSVEEQPLTKLSEEVQLAPKESPTVFRILFPLEGSDVLSDFENNAAELSRLDSLLVSLTQGSGDSDNSSISIIGYTSPEGTFRYNLNLAQRRTNSVKQWIQARYTLPASTVIHIENKGEDWEGLRQQVCGSGMSCWYEVWTL